MSAAHLLSSFNHFIDLVPALAPASILGVVDLAIRVAATVHLTLLFCEPYVWKKPMLVLPVADLLLPPRPPSLSIAARGILLPSPYSISEGS